MIGDRLYTLSERDIQARWLDPFLRQTQISVTITQIATTAFVVPRERVLILSAMCAHMLAGAGQTSNRVDVFLRGPTGGPLFRLFGETYAAVLDKISFFSGQVIVPASWTIFAEAFFNAAVAANLVELTAVGLLIPVGNVEDA